MPGKPAARVSDSVAHPLPPALSPGPGSMTVLIGSLPAWRGVPAAAAGALQSAKEISDAPVVEGEERPIEPVEILSTEVL